MLISGKPSLYLKYILPHRIHHIDTFPFNHSKSFYFFSCRYAFAASLKVLNIMAGDKVLIPSYICGVEIDPLLRNGIEPIFYRVKKNLQVDLDDLSLKSKIDGVRAIVVIHYLGFPQPLDLIQEICRENNLLLIEDCAHALLSEGYGRPLGSFGDVSCFSLLKTLPVPNGGVLTLNRDDLNWSKPLRAPYIFPTLYYVIYLLNQRSITFPKSFGSISTRISYRCLFLAAEILKRAIAVIYKPYNTKGLSLKRPDSYDFVEGICDWHSSMISHNIINSTQFDAIKIIRRRNFMYLLQHFIKDVRFTLPHRDLDIGICPLFFPIIMENSEKREMVYKGLKKKGIVTYFWWERYHKDVPWEDFPDAVFLKDRLLGLPIHQDLTIDHLKLLIHKFEETYHEIS